jgi:acetylornithine deacetylase/succinyl-diaminopimelate desuccinylase-like protein
MSKLLETLAAIGDTGRNEDGSYTRLGYSKEYFAAVDVVKRQMEELGLQTQVDAAGNLHGVLPGMEAGLKSIILGSHLDTVPSGGLYDGAYGVVARWR